MIPSPMSDDTCDRYTTGDCYVLAKELSDQQFGQLSSISVVGDWSCWSHMALKIGPDSYLDIEGIWSAEELLANHQRGRYEMTVVPVSDEEYFEMISGQAPPIDSEERVASVVQELTEWLESIN